MGSNVTGKAKGISSSKTKTKEYLESAGVPVPKGQKFIHKGNVEIKNNVVHQKKIVKDKELIDYLEERGLSLDYVPKDGERLFLRRHGTYLKDRLNFACTSTVDPKFKKYAVDALKSIPGLPTGSVDMIINEEKNEGIVNEINTKGEIAMHIFPLEGEAVDIPKYLIDYYFPGSKKVNNNFYFEYKPVKKLFLEGTADEITIPMYPEGEHYKKEFTVKGKGFGPVYLQNLKKRAARLHLKGKIMTISSNKLEIMLIGRKEEIDKFGKFIKRLAKDKTQVDKIDSSKTVIFDGVHTIALEVFEGSIQSSKKIGNTKNDASKNAEERISKLKKQHLEEKQALLKEKSELEEKYKELIEKKSGKSVESVKRIGTFIKRKIKKSEEEVKR
ncbi:acylphosphatase [Salinicoccus roseus]|uniref:acylphosphatase n=1 Tax=Salinicoccus roseus TaxID=45670 RepID=UPI003DA09D72